MKFRVSRASLDDDGLPPCDGAVQENGLWFVEIASLVGLMDFLRANPTGDGIVLGRDSILIYDDYIE